MKKTVTPMLRNNPKVLKKNPPAKKQWKAAPSKPSGISQTKNKNGPKTSSPGQALALPSVSAETLEPRQKQKNARTSVGARLGSISGSKASRKAPVSETLKLLKKYYPDAHCALHSETPFQLLVATVLSAQCTDERVNQVTPHLFAKYPTPFEMAKAPVENIEEIIRSTGFYKNKALNIKKASALLVEQHKGEVPKEMEALVKLPGVGRKTANVVLGNAFNITSGVVVDTHVTRLSNRLGWTRSENAVLIEQDLQKIIPKEDWILFSHLLISHGREVCKARKPDCDNCFLFEQCPKILKNS